MSVGTQHRQQRTAGKCKQHLREQWDGKRLRDLFIPSSEFRVPSSDRRRRVANFDVRRNTAGAAAQG